MTPDPSNSIQLPILNELIDLAWIGYGAANHRWSDEQKEEARNALEEAERIIRAASLRSGQPVKVALGK